MSFVIVIDEKVKIENKLSDEIFYRGIDVETNEVKDFALKILQKK